MTYLNSQTALEAINLDELDIFEQLLFHDFYPRCNKVEALQLIINSVEGDYSQLSPVLSAIARQQDHQLDNTSTSTMNTPPDDQLFNRTHQEITFRIQAGHVPDMFKSYLDTAPQAFTKAWWDLSQESYSINTSTNRTVFDYKTSADPVPRLSVSELVEHLRQIQGLISQPAIEQYRAMADYELAAIAGLHVLIYYYTNSQESHVTS